MFIIIQIFSLINTIKHNVILVRMEHIQMQYSLRIVFWNLAEMDRMKYRILIQIVQRMQLILKNINLNSLDFIE